MNFNQKSSLSRIARKYKLKLLLLFGSQAQNKTHAQSDLDLAFYPAVKINEPGLQGELMAVFKCAGIDLINMHQKYAPKPGSSSPL